MTQSKKQSAIEALTNILVGYLFNLTANFLILPIFGWDITLGENLALGVFYTIASFIRSYGLRRFYNWYHTGGGREKCLHLMGWG